MAISEQQRRAGFTLVEVLASLALVGVILPAANVVNLQLREEVAAACAEGRFHVYAVETLQQALELFTGLPAGTRGADGEYPEDSLLGRAVSAAHAYWEKATGRNGRDDAAGADDGEDA